MLKILANKVQTSGITIPEPVYVRTIQDMREGEVNENKTALKVWFSYKAYLKSKFDADGINAQSIVIDNLPSSEIVEIPLNDSLASYPTFDTIASFFNLKYIPTLKNSLNLSDSDISIV